MSILDLIADDVAAVQKEKEENEINSIGLIDFLGTMHMARNVTKKQWEYNNPVMEMVLYTLRNTIPLLALVKADRCAAVDDSKPYYKSMDYKIYKSDRTRMPEDEHELFQEACSEIRLILRDFFNIPTLAVDGAEADDIIAYLILQEPEKEWALLSADSDLDYLFGHSKTLRKYYKGKMQALPDIKVQYKATVAERLRINVPLYHALTSGHNTGIPIDGLGPVTAHKLISTIPEDMTDLQDAAEHLLKYGKISKNRPLASHRLALETNLALQEFPYSGIPDLNITPEFGIINVDLGGFCLYMEETFGVSPIVSADLVSSMV